MNKAHAAIHDKKSNHVAIAVAVSMVIIIIAWALWFYPAESAKQQISDRGFKSFANEILQSLSIFAKDQQQDAAEVDVDALRESVFGDSIQR